MRHSRALAHATAGLVFAAIASVGLVGLMACEERIAEREDEIAVEVERVSLDRNDTPVVILGERHGTRQLPIWIGSSEARSIAVELEDVDSPRPNTHDLATRVIQGLDGEVVRVVVTELRASTYYALLYLRRHGEIVEVDSRPSDAIAIALRTGTPIFVREVLFERDHEDETATSI